MTRFYQRNVGFKLVSLFLAILLWMYVTNEQDPTINQEFKNVPVKVMKLNPNFLVADMQKTVTVTVQGGKNKLSELTVQDIRVWVDSANAHLGENNLPVQAVSPDPAITVIGTKPASVRVRLDSRADKQVSVKVDIAGEPGKGLLVLDPVFKPTQITVHGPREVLKNVTQALVKVDISGADQPVTNDLPVQILDKWGNEVARDEVTVEPKFVNVMVPVIKNMPNKTVPIEPNLVGSPARGYQASLVVVEPETVKVFGAHEILSSVQTLKTTVVDIDQANADIAKEVGLEVPYGVTTANRTPVRVVVRITKGGQRYLEGIPLQLDNVPEGLDAVSKVDKVSIQVDGQEDVINRVQVSDFKAVVDTGGLRKGEHTLKVRVTGPEGARVVGVSPETVAVILREASHPN